jgi:hypothetical protein
MSMSSATPATAAAPQLIYSFQEGYWSVEILLRAAAGGSLKAFPFVDISRARSSVLVTHFTL